jgi:acetyl esterase/lipase
MALQLDPEVQAALAPMMAVMASMPKLAAGDVEGRRASFAGMLEAMFAALPIPTDVTTKDYHTTTTDGHSLLLRWISKTPSAAGTPTPAVVYAHGGGELCSFQGRLVFLRTNFLK